MSPPHKYSIEVLLQFNVKFQSHFRSKRAPCYFNYVNCTFRGTTASDRTWKGSTLSRVILCFNWINSRSLTHESLPLQAARNELIDDKTKAKYYALSAWELHLICFSDHVNCVRRKRKERKPRSGCDKVDSGLLGCITSATGLARLRR